ncbi:copper resistance protein CopC [Paenibacillus sp. N4]|uniref:copper resistance D family protein n=1 Tax=Paenibacillus vietnamensis TaxID=2590547 RepID=UPI001CD1868C|nr:copper resistance protein CopC [Paenibacillus vietnamensis]MCA0758047.1 copper resistance protein CopC [Paenibacillus vietnamensis]
MRNIRSQLQSVLFADGFPLLRHKYDAACLLAAVALAAACLMLLPADASAQTYAAVKEAAAFDPHEQVGHHQHQAGQGDGGVTAAQALLFAVRAAYYILLILVSGLMLWTAVLPEDKGGSARRLAGGWGLPAMRALLLVVLLYVFVHMESLMQGFDGNRGEEWLRLLAETTTGRSWLATGLLALLGFAVLRLPDPLKAVWALLLLASESFNGHVNALPSNTLAILLDFIHLACAALWAGGITLLLLYWRTERQEAGRFAERFAGIAWITIVLLTVSGIVMTALLLPSWLYLIYSGWGMLLLAKAVLLLLAAGTGFFLHRLARRGELPKGKLLKLDGVIMTAVLILAGFLTYVSPVPHTEPLNYHKMGEKLHYTLDINPNGPGPNQVKLKVWLPEQLDSPASVSLLLRPARDPERGAVEVPLRSDRADEDQAFPGFKQTDYNADNVVLASRGEWTAELVITDKAGGVTTQMIPFRND